MNTEHTANITNYVHRKPRQNTAKQINILELQYYNHNDNVNMSCTL